MAGKRIVREDVVKVSFATVGVEKIARGEKVLNGLRNMASSASLTLDELVRSIRGVDSDADIAQTGIDDLGDSVLDLADEFDDLKDSAMDSSEELDDLEDSAHDLKSELENLEGSAVNSKSELDDLGDSAEGLENLEDSILDSKEGLDDLGDSAQDAESPVNSLTDAADFLKDSLSAAAAAFSANAIIENVSEAQTAINTLQAQTGKTGSDMAALEDNVRSLYTNGVGSSLEEVANTTALVSQQFKSLDSDGIQQITQDATALSETFGMDVNETLRGVNALMTNMGLTAQQAFDYIAAGAQNGLDKSGELTDNLSEYSQIWSQAGFSAREMFTVLQNGLDSGAYNLDKVNDFVKEFSISLADGRIGENIDSFSESTKSLFEQWQNGTASQKDVFNSVIQDLGSMTNEQEALTLASNVWSALGEDNAMKVITSLNNVSAAYVDVEGTMQRINDIRYDDIGTSIDNIKRSAANLLEETLEPGVAMLSGWLQDGLQNVTAFAKEHQVLSRGMATAATTAGILTVGLIGVAGAIGVVTKAMDALSVSSGGTLKIAGLIVGGVSLLAGAFVGLHESMKADEVEDYNGTMEECRNEIELTESALKDARKRYGEDSDAVKDLESDLDTLNKQYEKGGGSLGELSETAKDASESIDELGKSIQSQNDETDSMEVSGLQAVSMLQALSEKSEKTNSDLSLMQSYADYLNDTFDCNIVVDYDTGKLTGFDPTVVVNQILDAADQARRETAQNALSDPTLLDNYTTEYKAMTEAQKQLAEIQEKAGSEYLKTRDELIHAFGSVTDSDIIDQMSKNGVSDDVINAIPEDILDQLTQAEETAKNTEDAFNSTNKTIKEQCEVLDETGSTYDMLVDTLKDYQDAAKDTDDTVDEQAMGMEKAQDVIRNYNDDLYNLCEAYDKAREAALNSIEGQYDAWDKVEEIETTSASSIVEALNSQNQYWEQYNENLETLQEKASGISGLGDMLASMSDGSEESAAALQGLATASDEELQTVVSSWQNLQQNQNDTADNMASVQTQFQTTLGQISSDMQSCVDGMDMSSQSYQAATNTMNGFIRGINDKMAEAQSALAALQIAGSGANVSITQPVEGNASGTTDAADVFVAGEQGPELIVGKSGSTVFPAAETQKVVDAVQAYAGYGYGDDYAADKLYSSSRSTTIIQNFSLTQNGGTSAPNQRQAKRWMQEAMEDAFASVLRTNPAIYTI
mgnify:CR=1 FL=1